MGIQPDEIKTELCCGVLHVTLPLQPRESEGVRISIA